MGRRRNKGRRDGSRTQGEKEVSLRKIGEMAKGRERRTWRSYGV